VHENLSVVDLIEVNSSVFPHSGELIFLEFHFCSCSSLEINVLWPLLGILLSKVKYLHLERIGVFRRVLSWAMSIYYFCEHYGLGHRNTCCVLCWLVQCMWKCSYQSSCLLNQFFICSNLCWC